MNHNILIPILIIGRLYESVILFGNKSIFDCYDAYGARLVQKAGFEAVYMTGNGVSATSTEIPRMNSR